MLKKTLLLNNNYEVLGFISERKAFRLLWKENKVEVLSNWDDEVNWGSGKINHPAILRLVYLVKRRKYLKFSFSRKLIMKRDQYCCAYCLKKLTDSQITIDHVIPKYLGGKTSFTNCVVSCKECNNKKGGKTPEQAGLTLYIKPTNLIQILDYNIPGSDECWHKDWDDYLV